MIGGDYHVEYCIRNSLTNFVMIVFVNCSFLLRTFITAMALNKCSMTMTMSFTFQYIVMTTACFFLELGNRKRYVYVTFHSQYGFDICYLT